MVTFWDSFRSVVHENSGLHAIDKFNYLKSLLNGSAATTIAGLPLTSANYDAAIELLTKRFENKQVIISSHMDNFLKLTPLGNTSDVRKLSQTYGKIEVHIRGLQSLDVPAETYGSLLVRDLMSKLPEDVRLLLGREIKDGGWNWTEILRLPRNEIENQERCNGIQALSTKESTYSPQDRWSFGPATAATLFSGEDMPPITNPGGTNFNPNSTTRCTYCKQLYCFICSGRHHVSLCESQKPENQTAEVGPSKSTPGNATNAKQLHPQAKNATSHTPQVGAHDSVLLQTAQAIISTENSEPAAKVRVIFDSGSQKSYISQQARDKLALPATTKESLLTKTFENVNMTEQPMACEKLKIAVGNVNKWSTQVIEVFVVPNLSPIGSQRIDTAKEHFAYLRGIEFTDDDHENEDLEIDVLVGADFMWSFFTGETKRGENGEGPVASCTILGWVLSGPVPGGSKNSRLSSVNFVSTHVLKIASEPKHENAETEELLGRLWDLESIGIRDKETVHEAFLEDISFTNGRYCVKMPLKEKQDLLPDNYDLSLSRLNSPIRRLRKEPSILKEYNQVFEDQLKDGIIERVDDMGKQPLGDVHYLPHQAVNRSDALTTKLRVVFDASSKVKRSSLSLNDCTYTGPPLTAGITDILMRFRAHKVGLVADIEKAFLNIEVDKQQRDLMRFLLIDDINSEDPNVMIYRFCRVIFGMNCSPFLLNATLKHHITKYYAHDSVLAQSTLDVDDWTSSGEDENNAYALYKATSSCFSTGGFKLRKWASNDKKVIEKITLDCLMNERLKERESLSHEDQSFAKVAVGGLDEIDPEKEHKVLGSNWNLSEDTFVINFYKVVEFAKSLEPTKRNVLRMAAKLFDPLGLVSPVTVVFRMLLQELCLKKCECK